MTKAELESKHLSELHTLAAEAGVERYRMLPREELIEKLAGGESSGRSSSGGGQSRGSGQRRGGGRGRDERPRKPRERKPRERKPRERKGGRGGGQERPEAGDRKPEPQTAPATTPPPARGKRKRRRRFGRRRKEVRLHELLLPPTVGRQTIVYGETRETCTNLLRGVAAELSKASKGPDPVAVLVDPTPEELADWRREVPQAEIVAAGQARHVEDAIAQAATRAGGGEDVIVLVDSLSRFAEAYGDADAAQEVFDAGARAGGSGSLTLVAAVEPAG